MGAGSLGVGVGVGDGVGRGAGAGSTLGIEKAPFGAPAKIQFLRPSTSIAESAGPLGGIDPLSTSE